jgi:hypothetical protein
MLTPFLIVIGFSLLLIVLDIFKPMVSRVILGIFFLIMALAVNLPLALNNPSIYVEAGREALLPIYKLFFTVVIAWNPPLFVFPLIVFESIVGLLILSKGRLVKLGLVAGVLFCLAITPINSMTITNPFLALAIGLLLHKNFDQSVLTQAVSSFKRVATRLPESF